MCVHVCVIEREREACKMLHNQYVFDRTLTTVKVGISHQSRWALRHTYTLQVEVAALITI